nr:proline-rich receptor-like protein kinase PERK2 [Aegilops tauschii subsp. strangulata]
MALPRPPSRRPLTPVDQRIPSIQERWLAALQNSGRDLASALRAPSPICCRPPRAPDNAVPAVPAPPPIPDLVVLGSAPAAPSTEPPRLGTLLGMGVFLTPIQGFSPVGRSSSSTSGVAMSTGPMPQAVARAGSSSAPPPLSFPPGFSPRPQFTATAHAPKNAIPSKPVPVFLLLAIYTAATSGKPLLMTITKEGVSTTL